MAAKDIEEKVNDIHRAIVGSAEYKQKGLIERVDNLEKAKWKERLGIGLMGGLVGSIVPKSWALKIAAFFSTILP